MDHRLAGNIIHGIANTMLFPSWERKVVWEDRPEESRSSSTGPLLALAFHVGIRLSNWEDPRSTHRGNKATRRDLTFVVTERHQLFIGQLVRATLFNVRSIMQDHEWFHESSHDSCWIEGVYTSVFKAMMDMHHELYGDLDRSLCPKPAYCDYGQDLNFGNGRDLPFGFCEVTIESDTGRNAVQNVGGDYWKKLVGLTLLHNKFNVTTKESK